MSHIPVGKPDSIMCRWCRTVRTIFRRSDYTFRLCRTCDGRTDVAPTWAEAAS